jgi:hypothetical protein
MATRVDDMKISSNQPVFKARPTTLGRLLDRRAKPAFLPIAMLCLLGMHGGAIGQARVAFQAHCESDNRSTMESFFEHPGTSIKVLHSSCRIQGGPLHGATMTSSSVLLVSEGQARLVAGYSNYEKSGATVAAERMEESVTVSATDGQITGWSSTGRDFFKTATGSAESLSGTVLRWTARSTARGQYLIETSGP